MRKFYEIKPNSPFSPYMQDTRQQKVVNAPRKTVTFSLTVKPIERIDNLKFDLRVKSRTEVLERTIALLESQTKKLNRKHPILGYSDFKKTINFLIMDYSLVVVKLLSFF